MTDKTHPDSGFPIAYSHYATYAEYVEALHARIVELEAQIASSGFTAADMATAAAQGFRDGVASIAASAVSEPVAYAVFAENGNIRVWATEPQHVKRIAAEQGLKLVKLYTHPCPPEGMVGGWLPIETAPKNGTEILGYTEEVGALVLYWDSMTGEMDHWSDGMSVRFWKPTHWMPLPAAPGPADGESNG